MNGRLEANALLHLIRGGGVATGPTASIPDDYTQSQAYVRRIRWPFADDGSDGVVYHSVRPDYDVNVCVLRPTALPLPIVQGTHYEYVWDAHCKLTGFAWRLSSGDPEYSTEIEPDLKI